MVRFASLCIEIRPFIVVIYFNCFFFCLSSSGFRSRLSLSAKPSNLRNRTRFIECNAENKSIFFVPYLSETFGWLNCGYDNGTISILSTATCWAFYISYPKPSPIFVYDRLQNTTKTRIHTSFGSVSLSLSLCACLGCLSPIFIASLISSSLLLLCFYRRTEFISRTIKIFFTLDHVESWTLNNQHGCAKTK